MYVQYHNASITKRRWFVVLMLFIIYPLGLYFLWNTVRFRKTSRIVLTILFFPWFLFWSWIVYTFIYGWNHADEVRTTLATQQQPQVATVAPTTTPAPSPSTDVIPTPDNIDERSFGALVAGVVNDPVDGQKQEPQAQVPQTVASIEVSSGNYVFGKDIPPGTYDIEAIQGYGTISSSGTMGINGSFSADMNDGDQGFMATFKNATFNKGEMMRVNGSLVVRLTKH
ncbi:MAG: hypothetical protein RR335_11370 [Eubacterium sp.]